MPSPFPPHLFFLPFLSTFLSSSPPSFPPYLYLHFLLLHVITKLSCKTNPAVMYSEKKSQNDLRLSGNDIWTLKRSLRWVPGHKSEQIGSKSSEQRCIHFAGEGFFQEFLGGVGIIARAG